MALIKCPACKADVSDRAAACVKCGSPLKKSIDNVNTSVNHDAAVQPAVSANASVSAAPQNVNTDTPAQGAKPFYAGSNTEPKKNSKKAVMIAVSIGLVCIAAAAITFFVMSNNPQKIFDLGMESIKKENYDEAIKHFSKAIELKPKESEYYYQRGIAYSEKRDNDKAIADFTEAIQLNSNNANYHFNRALAYHSLKDYDRAIEDYTEAIRLDHSDARFYNSRGSAYRLKEDYARAIADHTEAIRLNPDDERYHNNRGVAYLLNKEYDNAIANYTEAIRLAPDNARYYNNRGTAYNLKKDFFSAGDDFAEAVRLDPDNESYRKDLEKALNDQIFTDRRDGKKYRIVRIGNRIWMAENLNFTMYDSWCYDNNASNCVKYGRLYTWNAAMRACPTGWRLPADADWRDLFNAVGGDSIVGIKLKSKTEWNDSGSGTDDYGFSALPGGAGDGNDFGQIGKHGNWWSNDAWYWAMGWYGDDVVKFNINNDIGFSVRCVQSLEQRLTPTPSGLTGAGGDPRARVTHQGVLGIVSGQTKGKSTASADIFGKGSFAADIDAILSGGGESKVSSPDFLKSVQVTGARSRESIQRVVMQNMAALRHAYNRRLREKPRLQGTITVKFSIDQSGKVISAQVTGSTMNDPELEHIAAERVRSWNFERIDNPGDVTEVTYPFVFSQ